VDVFKGRNECHRLILGEKREGNIVVSTKYMGWRFECRNGGHGRAERRWGGKTG